MDTNHQHFKQKIIMAKKIFKFELQTTSIQQIKIQKNAVILCIQTQFETPCIWAMVDPDEPLESKTIEIHGTGHPIPDESKLTYIGTYQQNDGQLIFHCFESSN